MTSPVLVTGGTGRLGRLVVRRLRDAQCDVRVLTRRSRESADGVEFVVGDLAIAFAAFQARNFAGVPAVDRDPESYIRQAEQDYAGQAEQGLPARATGSLNIGSLKGQ